MANYTTKAGQSVYDIALQKYGSIEYVGEVMRAADQVVGEVPTGTVLALNNTQDNAITQYFALKRPIATVTR
jgi:hypothetical protein